MRNVFCKAENPKETIEVFVKKLREKYGIPSNKIIVDKKDNNIDCGYYHIHFCKEREWEILSTTKPGSGYLTVPYNRLLLSKNGVHPEMCKLNHLFNIVQASIEEEISTEKNLLSVTVANPDAPAPVIETDIGGIKDEDTAEDSESVNGEIVEKSSVEMNTEVKDDKVNKNNPVSNSHKQQKIQFNI